MLQEFINTVESRVGKAIYLWGGDGERRKTVAEWHRFIDQMEKESDNKARVKAFLAKLLADGVPIEEIYAYDCSGLGIDALMDLGLIGYDTTANGLKSLCTIVSMSQAAKGCFVFKVSDTDNDGDQDAQDRAHHIGYIVDDALNVVEAYGRDKGVIKRSFKAGGWEVCGVFPAFANEIKIEGGGTMALRRGDNNAEVGELQRNLTTLGYSLKDDDKYGPATEAAVRAFQKANGLEVDGIAGPKTQAKIDELLEAKKPDDSAKELQEKIDKLTAKVATLESAIKTIYNTAKTHV